MNTQIKKSPVISLQRGLLGMFWPTSHWLCLHPHLTQKPPKVLFWKASSAHSGPTSLCLTLVHMHTPYLSQPRGADRDSPCEETGSEKQLHAEDHRVMRGEIRTSTEPAAPSGLAAPRVPGQLGPLHSSSFALYKAKLDPLETQAPLHTPPIRASWEPWEEQTVLSVVTAIGTPSGLSERPLRVTCPPALLHLAFGMGFKMDPAGLDDLHSLSAFRPLLILVKISTQIHGMCI